LDQGTDKKNFDKSK